MSDDLGARVVEARNAMKEARKTFGADSAKYKTSLATYQRLQEQWDNQRKAAAQTTDEKNP